MTDVSLREWAKRHTGHAALGVVAAAVLDLLQERDRLRFACGAVLRTAHDDAATMGEVCDAVGRHLAPLFPGRPQVTPCPDPPT
jgi:hypothetical protein